MEADGIDVQQLEQALNTEKNVKYLYTIPNFQNPSGITMSLSLIHIYLREHFPAVERSAPDLGES